MCLVLVLSMYFGPMMLINRQGITSNGEAALEKEPVGLDGVRRMVLYGSCLYLASLV